MCVVSSGGPRYRGEVTSLAQEISGRCLFERAALVSKGGSGRRESGLGKKGNFKSKKRECGPGKRVTVSE